MAQPGLSQTEPSGVIDEIKVEGNRRSEADAIVSIIQTRAGSPLSASVVSEDIKSRLVLGFYRDIQVDLTVNKAGKRIVTFKVTEKPSIKTVEYKGTTNSLTTNSPRSSTFDNSVFSTWPR